MMNNVEKNENPTTVMYVVVSGEYSDFDIVSMWSSKEAAEDECALLKNNNGSGYDFRVREYLLNVSQMDGARHEIAGYKALYNKLDEVGSATAADVVVTNEVFFGESEGEVHHIKSTQHFKSFVVAHSASKEKSIALVLVKLAEIAEKK